MAKKDNFDDYRLQLLAKAREEEEKRLKVNRDLNKELKKQLESEDDIDKVINGVLKTESLREANLQAMIKLKQAETEEEKKKAQGAGHDSGVPYTIVRIETPVKLVPEKPKVDPISGKEIDPQTGKLT